MGIGMSVRAVRPPQPSIDVETVSKKLGRIDGVGHRITRDRSRRTRGKGWEYLHVCVDDAFRLAHTELPPVKRQESAAAFLVRALAWFVSLGVTAQRGDDGERQRLQEPCLPQGLPGG
jgi:hypothetical protein